MIFIKFCFEGIWISVGIYLCVRKKRFVAFGQVCKILKENLEISFFFFSFYCIILSSFSLCFLLLWLLYLFFFIYFSFSPICFIYLPSLSLPLFLFTYFCFTLCLFDSFSSLHQSPGARRLEIITGWKFKKGKKENKSKWICIQIIFHFFLVNGISTQTYHLW